MRKAALFCPILLSLAGLGAQSESLRVGSKKFTEGVILGEIATELARASGAAVTHRRELGGTRVLWNALLSGEIDLYPEYTGTITEEILRDVKVPDLEAMRRELAGRGVRMSEPLGFDNTYALGMREQRAVELGLRTISDLRRFPELVFGFSNEFMDRGDGWPSLRRHYGLPQRNVRGLDHDLAYRGLESGELDVLDLYSTDAEIRYYRLRVLEDDLDHFADYQAVLLYRDDLPQRAPGTLESLRRLEGAVTEARMIDLNARVKLDGESERAVAADFLTRELGVSVEVAEESALARFWRHTAEHLTLVGVSLLAAVLLAIPLGILAARRPALGQAVLGVVGVIQTIPSLALLVFMIPLLGIGSAPAIVALFLYSLLPIVRNTFTGLREIPPALEESAQALGLPPRAILWRVQLPLASPSILAGIKTSAVINVGTATLGALIGAGGYGQPILTGIRLDDVSLILEGAVPAAALALLVQGLFDLGERWLVPRGLRLG